jgi:hypothetical protein
MSRRLVTTLPSFREPQSPWCRRGRLQKYPAGRIEVTGHWLENPTVLVAVVAWLVEVRYLGRLPFASLGCRS